MAQALCRSGLRCLQTSCDKFWCCESHGFTSLKLRQAFRPHSMNPEAVLPDCPHSPFPKCRARTLHNSSPLKARRGACQSRDVAHADAGPIAKLQKTARFVVRICGFRGQHMAHEGSGWLRSRGALADSSTQGVMSQGFGLEGPAPGL